MKKIIIQEKKSTFNREWKQLEFKSWKLAPQADWSVIISLWETSLLVTAVMWREADENKDFLPLTVEFKETYYAAWKIWWGQYNKREWRPSDEAILISRLTDRPLRPMFPDGMVNDVVISILALSMDKENTPWILSIIWSSLALQLAWIPFYWPVSAVRIGYLNWEFIVNPTYEQIEKWEINLLLAWTKDKINMIECWSNEISEEKLFEAMEIWQKEINKVCAYQEEFINQFEIQKLQSTFNKPSEELLSHVWQIITFEKMVEVFPTDKKWYSELTEKLTDEVYESLKEKIEDEENKEYTLSKVNIAIYKVMKKTLRKILIEKEIRIDWRWLDDIRPLYCEVGLIPRVHGSWLFQRWETQCLCITTLGSPWDALVIDTMENNWIEKRFMHHYNMPPFANNEAKPVRFVSRRELWHWQLVEKTFDPMIPESDLFPYTIRSVSEILWSNGSTSMASTCATTLSLLNAWVPLKQPVSGIAMGLVSDEDLNFKVLTDIQWQEDFTWDMDFKITWTTNWINAIQLDMKLQWLPISILKEWIRKWNIGRLKILEFMLQTIDKAWPMSPHAPKMLTFKIEPTSVREVIWPWWSVINEIIKETWVKIDFKDDWTCTITAVNQADWDKAYNIIMWIARQPAVWDLKTWKITRVEKYWVFVSLSKSKTWLCHVKNLWSGFIEDPSTMFKEWDIINVKIIWIDKDWKIQLQKEI